MTLSGLVSVPEDALTWRPLTPGTRLAILRRLPEGGLIVRLQGEAGSVFPTHTHPGGEDVYVLSGDYGDESGSFGAGTFLSYPPGSRHQPYTVGGCDLLVVWWKGVVVEDAPA